MKRIITVGVLTVVALSVGSTAVVFAQETVAKPTTTTPTASVEQKPGTPTPQQAAALKARLEKIKTDLKIKLGAQEKTRLQARCKASQGLVSSLSGRVNGTETSRTEVYANITDRLTDLSAKFKNKGTDTTALDADIAILKTNIASFKTDLAVYKQNASDLSELDCNTDPDAFKAALLATRSAQETVNKDALAIRAYVNDTIKPLLKTLRAQLETKKATGE